MAGEAEARGALTSGFRSRALTMQMVDEAEVVLTAETRHRLLILEERPLAMRKTFSLRPVRAWPVRARRAHQDLVEPGPGNGRNVDGERMTLPIPIVAERRLPRRLR